MGRLRSYTKKTCCKLEEAATTDLGALDDMEVVDLVSDVVRSVLRLSTGCEAVTRLAMRNALLVSGIQAVSAILDPPDGEPAKDVADDEADDEPDPADDVEVGEEADEPGVMRGVAAKLWEIEQPWRVDVTLNEGARAASLSSGRDVCEDPLFESVDEDKLMTPLTQAFLALLDNYERETSEAEQVTDEEKKEMDRFLHLLSKTPHFRYLHKVLVQWDKADENIDDFMSNVYSAWFSNYRIGKRGPLASSGFEHVFVGEEKYDRRRHKSVISGFHNWIQFYIEEKRGNVNYLGFVGRADQDDSIVSVRFLWDDDDPGAEAKSVSTFLVGSSIAFDFSLATLIFFGREDDAYETQVEIAGSDVSIQAYKFHSRLGTHVRTVFLEG